jgi:hypothetical protein
MGVGVGFLAHGRTLKELTVAQAPRRAKADGAISGRDVMDGDGRVKPVAQGKQRIWTSDQRVIEVGIGNSIYLMHDPRKGRIAPFCVQKWAASRLSRALKVGARPALSGDRRRVAIYAPSA